jgi:hypothetical protein
MRVCMYLVRGSEREDVDLLGLTARGPVQHRDGTTSKRGRVT